MSSTPIRYRPAVASDAWEMIGVHFAAVQAIDADLYCDEVLSAWSPPPDEARRKWLASLVVQESTLCTVASSVDKVVGFCIALPQQAQLKSLYVHPDFAGRGIGQGLLQHIEERCQDLGLEALELNASRNAERFYQRRGYEVLGSVTQALTETLTMGATHMVKRFPSTDKSFKPRMQAEPAS